MDNVDCAANDPRSAPGLLTRSGLDLPNLQAQSPRRLAAWQVGFVRIYRASLAEDYGSQMKFHR